MKELPDDIDQKIRELFATAGEAEEVTELIEGLWTMPLNVGPEQLARSSLVIANGDMGIFRDIFTQKFYGDPRDLIMEAEAKLGNPGHYFIQPFPGPGDGVKR